jgi:hypothetical protein
MMFVHYQTSFCSSLQPTGPPHVDCSIGSVLSVSNVRCGVRDFLFFAAKALVANVAKQLDATIAIKQLAGLPTAENVLL